MAIPREPLLLTEIRERELGYKAWISVHTLGADGACGGVRIYPDVTREEVKLLSRAMTYKYAFFGRETGGAKGGFALPFDLEPEELYQALKSLGRHLEPLIRYNLYQPWTDMNCDHKDLAAIFEGMGLSYQPGRADSSYYTALSTFAGIAAAAEHLGLQPKQCRITIEGLGNVGTHLAREIALWGGKIIGCSTRLGGVSNLQGLNIEQLVRLREAHGDHFVRQDGDWERIHKEDLFDLPMNIHVPCARVQSITEEVAGTLDARAVVPAANVPYTDEGEDILRQRGVIILPDFIINGGGITGTSIFDLGGDDQRIRDIMFDDFHAMLIRLMRLADELEVAPLDLARLQAEDNYPALAASGKRVTPLHGKVVRALQDRRMLPRPNNAKKEAARLLGVIHDAFVIREKYKRLLERTAAAVRRRA